MSYECHMNVIWMSYECHLNVIWLSHACHINFICMPHCMPFQSHFHMISISWHGNDMDMHVRIIPMSLNAFATMLLRYCLSDSLTYRCIIALDDADACVPNSTLCGSFQYYINWPKVISRQKVTTFGVSNKIVFDTQMRQIQNIYI